MRICAFLRLRDRMEKYKDLKNNCLAIGSLPYNSVDEAMNIVRQFYYNIPFCPQLPKLSAKENMIIQYIENMPGIIFLENKVFIDKQKESFFDELKNLDLALKNKYHQNIYGLTNEYSKCFSKFLELITELKPKYAKVQVTGPFTLAMNLKDKKGQSAYYDNTFKISILKTLILKAIWQINQIKKCSPDTTPIVFIDEPMLSHLETSTFNETSQDEITTMLTKLSKEIQNSGALSAIHCCGKCNWSIPMNAEVNLINFDAFSYAENMNLYIRETDLFLKKGGKIVWGIVPTLDKEALINTNINELEEKLIRAKSYLTNNGIDKNLLDENSLISTSCGCGSLSVELAEKALKLTKELSDKLKG